MRRPLPDAAAVLDQVEASTRRRIVPPPRLPVADWLDEHRVIGREYPSPFPGPWRTSRTPYLREPLNDFVDPMVETLVLLFSSQVGKTETLMGTLLYAYGVDPGPGMLVLPTLELAESVSTDRLAPALASCATLAVGTIKASRSTDNAIRHKRINGLPLTLAGSNSAPSLASRPVRNLWGDEIDKWQDRTDDGDPLQLAIQRTAAFRRRKIVLTSTPTVKGASRIEDWYERSDQRKLFAPCPRCGERFVVEWHHVRWESGAPETAHLEHFSKDSDGKASGCGGRIEDRERKAMFEAAEWRATKPFTNIRGYRTWAVVSPWLRLSEIVGQFLKKKDRPETLRQWVNEIRGESWEPPSEKIESASLLMRRETYAADVPGGAVVLTAGIDTQDDRLEALVVGWGLAKDAKDIGAAESWVIDRESFFGDPAAAQVWAELDGLLNRAWAREGSGPVRIQCALIDALGHRTSAVYAAVVARQHRRLYASFGKDGGDKGQIVTTPKLLATPQGNVARVVVDASQAKALIYSNLKVTEPTGQGVVHFPMSVGDAFFTELTAEELRTERNTYGVPHKRWALRPGHQRNETLDCFGMALAALRIICPTPARFHELAEKIIAAAAAVVPGAPATPAPPKPRGPRTRNWNGGQ
jgi:phage terminase large subunit GpA-like protein